MTDQAVLPRGAFPLALPLLCPQLSVHNIISIHTCIFTCINNVSDCTRRHHNMYLYIENYQCNAFSLADYMIDEQVHQLGSLTIRELLYDM